MVHDGLKPSSLPYLFPIALSLTGYVIIGYFLERHQTLPLLTAYGVLFGAYLWIFARSQEDLLKFLIGASILFRISLLFSLPNLSDDIFRFIWDGRLLGQGINPFSQLPSDYQSQGFPVQGLDQELFSRLNSPDYFTIYPPIHQLLFWLSAIIFPDSILGSSMLIRSFIILAELGNLILIKKLLERLELPARNILLYAWNPLVILELTGNLHFEGIMIFFLLLGIYFFYKNQWLKAALPVGLAISTKLIPLIFLPLLIMRLGAVRSPKFLVLVGFTVTVLFLPLLNAELISGMSQSLSLYFQKFEFNASIYYLVREGGYWVKGYNIIETSGKYMALATFLGIVAFTIWQKNKSFSILQSGLWVMFIYLIFATTVHPWYISTLVAFSLFSQFRFPIIWSLVIFLTYSGYSLEGYSENPWVISIEYIITFGYLGYELYRQFFNSSHRNAPIT